MTMLEDELSELSDPSMHEPIRITVADWQQMEADCEEERWGFCLRCGGKDHYAKDCGVVPAPCPDLPMPRRGKA